MAMCCIGPEDFTAETAPFYPSDMLTSATSMELCALLNIVVGTPHLLIVFLLFSLSIYLSYFFWHVARNLNPPNPPMRSGMEPY